MNIKLDFERNIRNNETLTPLGINFDEQNFAFEIDPVGLQDYDQRADPNSDSTKIYIKKGNILYEGYLVKVKS